MDNDFKKKLASYGALSSAFVLVGNHEAEAQAIYVDLTDTPIEINQNFFVGNNSTFGSPWSTTAYTVVNLDMENASVNATWSTTGNADFAFLLRADYYFINRFNSSNSSTYTSWNNANAGNRLIKGNSNVIGVSFPSNLPAGTIVGPGFPLPFNASQDSLGYRFESDWARGSNTNDRGNFFAGGAAPSDVTGYLGVRFDIGGNTHYGWVRIRVEMDAYPANGVGTSVGSYSKLTILDYAYQSKPNTPLRVGDKEGLEVLTIPTMGQWGLIVLNLLLVIFGVQVVQERRKLKLRKRN
jgi:hypothetical protein